MFANGGVTSNASIRASGRLVTMPALMKYTANAPRVAAAAIMLHPGIRTAASIAGWLGLASLAYDPLSNLWTVRDPSYDQMLSDGYYYYDSNGLGGNQLTPIKSCASFLAAYGDSGAVITQATSTTWSCSGSRGIFSTVIYRSKSSCPAGWYSTPAGCVQTPPLKSLTQEQAVEEIIKHPMPAEVPKYIPEPLPVEMPYFEPLFIPTGNPVANPKYDPSKPLSPENQPYVQPGTKVTPAPAPGAPWQVDTVPVNRPTPTPEGSTEPVPDSPTEPSTDTPREDGKEDRDFCDKNPNVLACLELDTPEGEIPKGTFNVTYAVENSWGNGSCPADKYATLAGKSVKVYDWEQTCDYVATYVRPILLLLCALGALFIVMPGRAET